MYYAIDGDDVGRRLEQLLLQNDSAGAAEYSSRVANALEGIRSFFLQSGAQVIFCAGDGLLAHSDACLEVAHLLEPADHVTFSIGIGGTPALALLALKKAKGLGRRRVEAIKDGDG